MSEPKFVISLPGFDAAKATPEQSVIHSDTEILKIIDQGELTIALASGGLSDETVIPHLGEGFNMVIATYNGVLLPLRPTSQAFLIAYPEDKQVRFVYNTGGFSFSGKVRYKVFSLLLK